MWKSDVNRSRIPEDRRWSRRRLGHANFRDIRRYGLT